MAIQNNPVPSANSTASNYAAAGPQADPYGVTPSTAINTSDSYSGSSSAPSPAVAPSGGMMSGLLGSLGIGKILGWVGGGFLGLRFVVPKVAAAIAPKVLGTLPRFGIIGACALVGGLVLGKLFGHKAAAAPQQ